MSTTQGPEIITFRFAETLVYVKPVAEYNDALKMAQNEFRTELAGVPQSNIHFYIQATMHGAKKSVRVSQSAWPATTARMLRGEVIDVKIEAPVGKEKGDSPPEYSPAQARQCNQNLEAARGGSRWFNRP